jgi:hypothetical protein
VECTHGDALLPQEIKIDICDGDVSVLSEALAFRQQHSVLEDGRLAVPGQPW